MAHRKVSDLWILGRDRNLLGGLGGRGHGGGFCGCGERQRELLSYRSRGLDRDRGRFLYLLRSKGVLRDFNLRFL